MDVEFRRGRVQSQKVGWSLASGGGHGVRVPDCLLAMGGRLCCIRTSLLHLVLGMALALNLVVLPVDLGLQILQTLIKNCEWQIDFVKIEEIRYRVFARLLAEGLAPLDERHEERGGMLELHA